MDIQDVSDIPQYMDILLKQQSRLQDAQLLKGQRPKQGKRRDELIMQFRFRLMRMQQPAQAMRTSFIPPVYIPCAVPLSSLTKVVIGNLTLETHHRGSYVLLRSITPADRMTGIMAIMEDEKGDVVTLQLYYQAEETERAADDILPEGVVVIIKEPYLKVMADGDYGIRVDHLTDVEFDVRGRIPKQWQSKSQDESDSASVLKQKGNSCFTKSKYFEAIEHYSQGIIRSDNEAETHTLKLNRSLAYLKTKQYDAALSDLDDNASPMTKPSEKSLYRKAQALYNLDAYRACTDVLKVLIREYPSAMANAELKRTISRLTEQKSGIYQFKKLYAEADVLRPPHLDHSTYIGPVEVRSSGTRGRGLFTTAAVKAGDLLMCEKAFAHAFHDSNTNQGSEMVLLLIPETNSMTMGTQPKLIEMIAQKLYRNPSLVPIITDLHHGSYKPVTVSTVNGTPVVDSFHIQKVISLNCFGCPLSTREYYLDSKISQAINMTEEGPKHDSCGLWPKASYINHCCYSNIRRSFIGDMMIVRAAQNLAPNTEITFGYRTPEICSYDDRQKGFRTWGFHCDCPMCQDDQKADDTILPKRKSLRAEALKYLQALKTPDTAKLRRICTSIADTYTQPATKVPRLAIWDLFFAMAQMYVWHQQPMKVIEFGLECLASLGYVIEGGKAAPLLIKSWGLMQHKLVECWMLISMSYRALDLRACEARAYEYAKISYRILIGEDETFEETDGMLENQYSGAFH